MRALTLVPWDGCTRPGLFYEQVRRPTDDVRPHLRLCGRHQRRVRDQLPEPAAAWALVLVHHPVRRPVRLRGGHPVDHPVQLLPAVCDSRCREEAVCNQVALVRELLELRRVEPELRVDDVHRRCAAGHSVFCLGDKLQHFLHDAVQERSALTGGSGSTGGNDARLAAGP